jgi:hypothetical protein
VEFALRKGENCECFSSATKPLLAVPTPWGKELHQNVGVAFDRNLEGFPRIDPIDIMIKAKE